MISLHLKRKKPKALTCLEAPLNICRLLQQGKDIA
jgi:hypothetical protein